MTESQRSLRRNRVDERFAAAIAVVGAAAAVLSGAAPTGSAAVDWLMVAAAVGAVIWASASAPWWAPAGIAGVAAVVALQPMLAVIGAVAFVGGLSIGVRRRDQAELRALVTALGLNVLIRSQLDGFLGLSAIVGVGLGAVMLVVGVRRRPSLVRRRAWIATGAVGAVGVLAIAAAALAAQSVRSDLVDGNRQARQAVDLLNAGDYQQAAARFDDSSRAFASVESGLGGVLGGLVALLPGAAQNMSAGVELAATASDTTGDIAIALGQVDADSLSMVDGAIDLDAVRAVEQPLVDVQASLDELRATVEGLKSPWLISRVQSELDELEAEFDDNLPRLANAIEAVRLAPQLLGGDGMRRYMVMFNSPVEARGLAGFLGNFAIVTLDDGRIEVAEFGRRSELDDGAPDGVRCDGCPTEMIDRYGVFGLDIGDGTFGKSGWTAVTMPAHFPYVGEATQIMYPRSGGEPLDGVISMDPYVVQTLMAYTGPIELPEAGLTVRPQNAAEFLLEGQYLLLDEGTNDERIEAIDQLGQQVIRSLLAGALPAPSQLARDLGPMIAEQRLLVWTDNTDEQALLERVGMMGALPAIGDDGGFSVVVTNQGRNKIDAFLDRTVEAQVVTAADGRRTLVADVTLHNDAPAGGLPGYVIGNSFGFPEGTSYLWVNFFGPPGTPTVTRNGEPFEVGAPEPEAGWWASAFDAALRPGDSVTYRVEYTLGAAIDEIDSPVRWDQPLARRER